MALGTRHSTDPGAAQIEQASGNTNRGCFTVLFLVRQNNALKKNNGPTVINSKHASRLAPTPATGGCKHTSAASLGPSRAAGSRARPPPAAAPRAAPRAAAAPPRPPRRSHPRPPPPRLTMTRIDVLELPADSDPRVAAHEQRAEEPHGNVRPAEEPRRLQLTKSHGALRSWALWSRAASSRRRTTA